MLRSSTSNSSTEFRPIRLVVCSVLLAGVGLGLFEFWLRAHGAVPSLDNTEAHWSIVRSRVKDDPSPDSVALLGASRMQTSIDHETLSAGLDADAVHNLSFAGLGPYASFADLAENTDFKGLVIVSMLPAFLIEGWAREEQEDLVAQHHAHWNAFRKFDALVATYLGSRFAFQSQYYELLRTVKSVLQHGRPAEQPNYLQTLETRENLMRFEHANLELLRAMRVASSERNRENPPMPGEDEWLERVAELDALTRKITDRGGRVVFVRMPSSGPLRELEAEFFPRETYWDTMAANISAPAIHFEDLPKLAALDLPEYSHIDAKDRQMFTEAIMEELIARGVADNPDPVLSVSNPKPVSSRRESSANFHRANTDPVERRCLLTFICEREGRSVASND